jgi:phage-related protein
MSSFYARTFMYDGIPCEYYNDLRILNFDTSGVSDSDGGSGMTIQQKYIYRRSKPFYYGRTQDISLEFEVTVGSENNISSVDRARIESWLLGRMEYLPFQVQQDDLQNVVFYTLLTKSTNKYIGNLNYGLTLHAQCNAPWGFEYPKTLTKNYSGSAIVNEIFNFNNTSDDSDYNYPAISFTTSGVGSGITITNLQDSSRQFVFSGISSLETMTVDNDRQIISSSTGLLRLSNFNKKFLRLVPGKNTLTIAGGITNFSMTTTFARKVGA